MGSGASRFKVKKSSTKETKPGHQEENTINLSSRQIGANSLRTLQAGGAGGGPEFVPHTPVALNVNSNNSPLINPLSGSPQLLSVSQHPRNSSSVVPPNILNALAQTRGSFSSSRGMGTGVNMAGGGGTGRVGVEIISNETREQALESEMFAHTAMSLGLEQEDLLFNLLYFGGGALPDFNSAVSNARDETLALHSENNTPYKLRPADSSIIELLKSCPLHSIEELDDSDCAVCKEEMEINTEVIFIPSCSHCFHKECLIRWISLVRNNC